MVPTTESEASVKPTLPPERLEFIVPYTTHAMTQRALVAAGRIAGSNRRRIRVIRVVEVPVHLSVESTAIPIECLRGELLTFKCDHEFYGELVLTRDAPRTWADLANGNRLVVIASERRVWKTKEERLARLLARTGLKTVVVYGA